MPAVVDVDSHVYEPPVIWERYVPAEYRSMAKSAFYHEVDDEGNRLIVVNGAPGRDLNRHRLVRQAIWRPGMTTQEIGSLDPERFHPLTEGAFDAAARLVDMDAMGVDHAVVFPTLFTEYLPLVVDPNAAAVLATAYNDWVWDLASQSDGRLHPVAILPMQSILLSRRELDRVAEKGFGAVVIRPAFYKALNNEDSFGGAMVRMLNLGGANGVGAPAEEVGVFVEDKPFRALWRQIDQLGMVACVHPSLGITGPDAVSNGGFTERVSAGLGLAHTVAEPIAYMQDAQLFVTAALFHGLLEDLPTLRLAILHSGITWVPLALEKAETYLWLGGFGMTPVCLEPEEVFERHPIVVSFDSWERPVARMPDVLGNKAAWGSRYPQHDAAGPQEARAMLEHHRVDEPMIERLLGGNAAELFKLEIAVSA
jgi:predicted TIM-barrel fold metal-dependent hydrolase